MKLSLQPCSEEVLLEKYAKDQEKLMPGEQAIDAIRRRVDKALASVEADPPHWEERFYAAQTAGVIMAGRINSAAGTDLQATLINCFVQPVGDSTTGYEQSVPGIYPALTQAAETMRRGGGLGTTSAQ